MNIYSVIPTELPAELIETILEGKSIRIERIISRGHASAPGFWYDQAHSEWVLLAQGSVRLQFEDGSIAMGPGDFVNIPAHRKHRVEWTAPNEPTIWLAVHYDLPTAMH
jgi:cupin 2 domain-containing protein